MTRKNTYPSRYTLIELLDEPLFVAWVLKPDHQLDAHWNAIKASSPQLSALIDSARTLVLSLKFRPEHMEKERYQQLWQQIAVQTVETQTVKAPFPMWIKTIAAAMISVIALGASFYIYSNRQIEITTAYGQTRTVIMPDSSEVTLNANSTLSYSNNWKQQQKREIWLKGEALFKIKHLHRTGKIAPGELFQVHAGMANISVLGTTFNIYNRRNYIKVALISGGVSLEIAKSGQLRYRMQPGEVLSYALATTKIKQEIGNASSAVAWTDGRLIFNEISAAELFLQLKDTYGYTAIFENPALKEKKISGTFSAKNYDNLLKGIEVALGISIRKDNSTRQLFIH